MAVSIFNVSLCCLLLCLIQTITCDSSCIYDVGNGQKLDIRTLGNANGKGPKYDNIPNSSPVPYTFNWNGCFPYSKAKGDCTNAAACYTDKNTGASTLIAKHDKVDFENHENVYTLIYHTSSILLTVYLTCREDGVEKINGRQDDQQIFNIYLQSPCCCPGKCHYSGDRSLSGGAIFIIILFVLLVVYIVGGMIFLRYARGATGADMIPNRLMWLGIVSYAIDGVRYSIQVVRQRNISSREIMSISERLMLSSMFNLTRSRYTKKKFVETTTNHSDNSISSDLWLTNRFTIVQRTFFIFSLIVLFWILFVVIYMTSRLILRIVSNFKRFHFHYDSPSTSNDKICRAFVISPHQYGSFRPTHMPSPLIPRSDSLFSAHPQQTISQQTLSTISQSKTNQTTLLEHYLRTYNPLKIDLKPLMEHPIPISTIIEVSDDQAQSDTDTHPVQNCYALHCANKRKIHQGERYTRLKEETCSVATSTMDDRLSECSTRLTSVTLPTVMVTDCSDSQRLHTDIIELNEDDKDK
ncbi:unnamed protein product [Adineta ricciae]|uniref:Uncharacterized protein n=1 Tax=Adineta ricciae TaxID=249248 RepID=A0A814J3Q8_ADIRI|nr:unnamed protein product [Adineta ricciae]